MTLIQESGYLHNIYHLIELLWQIYFLTRRLRLAPPTYDRKTWSGYRKSKAGSKQIQKLLPTRDAKGSSSRPKARGSPPAVTAKRSSSRKPIYTAGPASDTTGMVFHARRRDCCLSQPDDRWLVTAGGL